MNKLATLIAAIAITLSAVSTASAWDSSDKWGSVGGVTSNNFTIRNNVWGSNPGPQSIWASWGSNWVYWGVWASHSGGGIKSYPHIEKYVGTNTNNIPWAGANYNVRRPNTGAYNSAFDIWFNGDAIELMLWMNQYGPVGPIGSWQDSETVGGHSWNVYRGWNGYNDVISLIRTSNSNSGNIDLKSIYNYVQSRGWFYNPYLNDVQFGFEISSGEGVWENTGFAYWQG